MQNIARQHIVAQLNETLTPPPEAMRALLARSINGPQMTYPEASAMAQSDFSSSKHWAQATMEPLMARKGLSVETIALMVAHPDAAQRLLGKGAAKAVTGTHIPRGVDADAVHHPSPNFKGKAIRTNAYEV